MADMQLDASHDTRAMRRGKGNKTFCASAPNAKPKQHKSRIVISLMFIIICGHNTTTYLFPIIAANTGQCYYICMRIIASGCRCGFSSPLHRIVVGSPIEYVRL